MMLQLLTPAGGACIETSHITGTWILLYYFSNTLRSHSVSLSVSRSRSRSLLCDRMGEWGNGRMRE